MQLVKFVTISNYTSEKGTFYNEISLSYQHFGIHYNAAPVVLVNHALTGNSNVIGKNGWWNGLIGLNKPIDTNKFSVVCFNIPGNGFVKNEKEFDYNEFCAADIAKLFKLGLEQLGVFKLYAIIGSSLGGGIAWEMAVLFPKLATYIIPVASHYEATDWVLGFNKVQFQILNNSIKPLHDARMMAMLFYRTPQSFEQRFNRTINSDLGMYNIESWLLHHGKTLEKRFTLHAYKVMTYLLGTIAISSHLSSLEAAFNKIESKIILVGVNTDLFFIAEQIKFTQKKLLQLQKKAYYHEITSIHGHDAFLIEFEQLNTILKPYF